MPEQLPYNSDIELFTREITWDTRPTWSKLWSPFACSVLGVAFVGMTNFLNKRPIISGIQKHVLAVAVGIPTGFYLQRKIDERFAERDAALVHYMKLHPEDFPPTERKKYKDVLLPWIPVR